MSGRHESFERTTGEGHSADIWARRGSKILLGRPVELFSVEPVPIMPVAAGLPRGKDDRVGFPLNKVIWNMVTGGGGSRVGGGKGALSYEKKLLMPILEYLKDSEFQTCYITLVFVVLK